MAWIRLEDTFPEHTKIDAAGGDAAWLHVCAIGYCNRNRTDGKIVTNRVARLSDRKNPLRLAQRLVEVGLWERRDDGFEIHDYLHYNPSRAELEAEEARRHDAKSAAGKLGGIASGIARRKHGRSKHEAEHEAEPEAEGQAETKRNEAPSHPIPSPPRSVVTTVDNSSSSRTGTTEDDVVSQALSIYADLLALKNAEPTKRQRYADQVRSNGNDHWKALGELQAIRPDCSAQALVDAYQNGGWPRRNEPNGGMHDVSCVCDGTGWVLVDPDDESRSSYSTACTAEQGPSATVHPLRRAQ